MKVFLVMVKLRVREAAEVVGIKNASQLSKSGEDLTRYGGAMNGSMLGGGMMGQGGIGGYRMGHGWMNGGFSWMWIPTLLALALGLLLGWMIFAKK